jgi:predicted transport protein
MLREGSGTVKQSLKAVKDCIEALRVRYNIHRHNDLKEYPTRTIFIDPLLAALGWDVRDPDEVELEYPTIDGKSVDYALKVNRVVVALLEAKPLRDPLADVKGITQVVSYAAIGGIEWCILTNGMQYRVYSSSQKAIAPNKLLFEVSIDPGKASGQSVDQIATQLERFSRDSMARGVLDQLGEEIFTTAKVRKALDHLFVQQDGPFFRSIRKAIDDEKITPTQIRAALNRLWPGASSAESNGIRATGKQHRLAAITKHRQTKPEYLEAHHIEGKPVEVVELYRALDKICHDLAPGKIDRRYQAKHVGWLVGKFTFCSAHLLQSGLKVWLRLSPDRIPASADYARDVSRVGHWGTGDVELLIDTVSRLRDAEPLIRASFERTPSD